MSIGISIIGFGSLSKSFIEGLCYKNILPKLCKIKIFNRTKGIPDIKDKYHGYLEFVENINELIGEGSYIFLMLPYSVILDLPNNFINEVYNKKAILVSCANGLTIKNLEKKFSKIKIIRLLPNINWQIGQGVTLYQKGVNVNDNEINNLINFLSNITYTYKVDIENDFNNLGTLTSCIGGLLPSLLFHLSKSFKLNNDKTVKMFIKSCLGSLNLIDSENLTFDEIILMTSKKGGLTETGIESINNNYPYVCKKIYDSVKNKINLRKEKIDSTIT